MSIESVPDATLPARLGRYKIVAELGRGAMGTVYHGIDETIERPVALKTLNAELPAEILGEVRERFLREAKSAGQLNHPNIVTIYEFGQDGNTAFIAMEFLEGKSLQQVIREGRLPFATIVDLVAQIAEGLDYAHRFGVVHRDIKPANIMVSPHGLAKLTDFGIARIESSSMTQTGAMLGSPKYMSPEQVLGQPADGRADIFSLGVVLYEMLAARTPFETPDATVFSLMQRIVTVPHDPILVAVPGTPPAFEAILTRALAKRPEQRYQRAGEFANDLRNFKSVAGPAALSADADKTTLLPRPAVSAGSTVSSITFDKTVATHPGAMRPDAGAPAAAALAVTVVQHLSSTDSLLGDLDNLGAGLDEMHQKIAAEETSALTAMRGNTTKSKDWELLSSGIEHVPEPGAKAPAGAATRSGGVFAMLKEQSGTHLKAQASASREAAHTAIRILDTKLRAGYAFLAEFMRAANAANPIYAAKHTLPLLGDLPPLYFSDGVVNMRTKRVSINGAPHDLVDELILSYNLVGAGVQRAAYPAPQLTSFKTLLEEHEMTFKMKETRNPSGTVIHAGFEYQPRVVCAMTLRADITGQAVDINCRNIGPLGRRRYRVTMGMLDDTLFEELSKVMLGHFSPLLARQAVAN